MFRGTRNTIRNKERVCSSQIWRGCQNKDLLARFVSDGSIHFRLLFYAEKVFACCLFSFNDFAQREQRQSTLNNRRESVIRSVLWVIIQFGATLKANRSSSFVKLPDNFAILVGNNRAGFVENWNLSADYRKPFQTLQISARPFSAQCKWFLEKNGKQELVNTQGVR